MTSEEPEPAIALDTSVIVAALLSWHRHHAACYRALTRVLHSKRECVLPLPALLEAYSVMTRVPAPHRLLPADALRLLSDAFRERFRLTALASEDGWRFMRSLVDREISGGRTYDAVIMACAQRGEAREILTLNRRHFDRLVSEIAVGEPE